MTPGFKIHQAGDRFILLQQGAPVGKPYRTAKGAATKAAWLARQAGNITRPCTSCGVSLTTDSRFVRLCPTCNAAARRMMI